MSNTRRIGVESFFDTSGFDAGQQKYVKGLREAGNETESVAGKMGGSGGGGLFAGVPGILGNIANVAAGAVVAGFVAAAGAAAAFGVSAVNSASDFQAKMSGVAAVSNATGEELKALTDLALDLGADTQLTVSTSGAADVLETLSRNGVSTTAILDGAARSAILLANASGASFETAADISSKAMSIFGINAEDMTGAVNGITAVTNLSTFGVEDYALALAQGGGVAARVGLSFDDFNTTITALSSSFMSGSDAGTSLKTLLTRLVPSTDDAAKMMADLGLEFFNADGSMRSMSEITQELHDSLSGLSDQEKINAATTLFGADSMRAALALSEMTGEQFDTLGQQMAGMDAGEMAAQRVNNLKGAMDILGGAFETLQIKVGSLALPWLQQMALAGADAITGLGTAVEPASVILGDLANYLILAATDGDALNDHLGALPPVMQPIVEAVGNVLSAFQESMPMVMTFVTDMQNTVTGAAATLGPQFQDKIIDILTKVGAFWTAHGDEVMAVVNFLFRTVVAIVGVAMGTILSVIDIAITTFTGIWAAGSKLLQGDWKGAIDAIYTTAVNFGVSILRWAEDTIAFVIETFSGGTLTLSDDWHKAFDGIVDWVRLWGPRLASGLKGIIDAAVKLFTDIKDNWQQIGKDIINGLVLGVAAMAYRLVDAVGGAINDAIAKAKELLGINSPSRVGIELGMQTDAGIALGFLRGIPAIERAAALAASAAAASAQQTLSATMTAAGGMVSNTTINNSRTLNVSIGSIGNAGGMVRSLRASELLVR